MKRKELTNTFVMFFNLKNLHGLYKNISALQGLGVRPLGIIGCTHQGKGEFFQDANNNGYSPFAILHLNLTQASAVPLNT